MKQRYFWIDNIRAIALISMIIYHAVWDLVWLYGVDWDWYRGELAFVWQQSICWTFILLSGFCWSFCKNPLKQGLLVSVGGLIVTAVTLEFSYQSRIVFGVLNLIGASALLMIPLKKIFEKIPAGFGALISFLIFAVTYRINDGLIGFFGMELTALPDGLYKNLLTAFLGFPNRSFFSTDYFSVLPWTFLYFAGYFLYRLWRDGKIPGANCLNRRIPVLTKLGKHSLMIYMLHQPLIYGVLSFLFWVL